MTPYLAGKLAAYGQTILDDEMNRYWGRCTTGQARPGPYRFAEADLASDQN